MQKCNLWYDVFIWLLFPTEIFLFQIFSVIILSNHVLYMLTFIGICDSFWCTGTSSHLRCTVRQRFTRQCIDSLGLQHWQCFPCWSCHLHPTKPVLSVIVVHVARLWQLSVVVHHASSFYGLTHRSEWIITSKELKKWLISVKLN